MYDRNEIERLNEDIAALAAIQSNMASVAAATTEVNSQTFIAKMQFEYPHFAQAPVGHSMTNILIEGLLIREDQTGQPLRSPDGSLTVKTVMRPPVGHVSIQGKNHQRDIYYNEEEHKIEYGLEPLTEQEKILATQLHEILRENTLRQINEIRECLEYGQEHPAQQARLDVLQNMRLPGGPPMGIGRGHRGPAPMARQNPRLPDRAAQNLPANAGQPAIYLARKLMNEYNLFNEPKIALEAKKEPKNITR